MLLLFNKPIKKKNLTAGIVVGDQTRFFFFTRALTNRTGSFKSELPTTCSVFERNKWRELLWSSLKFLLFYTAIISLNWIDYYFEAGLFNAAFSWLSQFDEYAPDYAFHGVLMLSFFVSGYFFAKKIGEVIPSLIDYRQKTILENLNKLKLTLDQKMAELDKKECIFQEDLDLLKRPFNLYVDSVKAGLKFRYWESGSFFEKPLYLFIWNVFRAHSFFTCVSVYHTVGYLYTNEVIIVLTYLIIMVFQGAIFIYYYERKIAFLKDLSFFVNHLTICGKKIFIISENLSSLNFTEPHDYSRNFWPDEKPHDYEKNEVWAFKKELLKVITFVLILNTLYGFLCDMPVDVIKKILDFLYLPGLIVFEEMPGLFVLIISTLAYFSFFIRADLHCDNIKNFREAEILKKLVWAKNELNQKVDVLKKKSSVKKEELDLIWSYFDGYVFLIAEAGEFRYFFRSNVYKINFVTQIWLLNFIMGYNILEIAELTLEFGGITFSSFILVIYFLFFMHAQVSFLIGYYECKNQFKTEVASYYRHARFLEESLLALNEKISPQPDKQINRPTQ